ncbi:MAG: hypothetical protein CMM60_06660 [Rhodospirillaceae bacterium]|jgi:hypothetical protein|nr:hypothetical protein [Rhodospirillaceae bacterium]|tara:strand:+ start:94 stop:291 length:198 start_codon:yes stop_codon:yes gene_type:complete
MGLAIDRRHLAEDAALADLSQYRFDPVDDLENPVPGLQGPPLKYAFGHSPVLCWSVATFDFVLSS